MKEVGFGVIGTGFWGRNHARVLSELKNTKLVAVCDIDLSIAETIGKKFNTSWCSSDDDLLKNRDVEAVCVCSPTTTHAKIAVKAIKYGKHVLIEKPIASTVAQAKHILKQSIGKNIHIMVGFIERFNPALRRLRSIVERGDLGEVVLASARRVGRWPKRIGDVGVIKDSAIHDIDIMRFLFKEEPSSIYARAGSISHKFEDYAQIMLNFSGIKTGFIEANWLTPHKVRTLTVTGKDAIAGMDYISQEIVVEDVDKKIIRKYKWEEPLKLEIEHFANCIVDNREPEVSALDGLRALQICDLALLSANKGKVIQY